MTQKKSLDNPNTTLNKGAVEPKEKKPNILEEKMDACLDAVKELTKSMAELIKSIDIKKKAGNF